MLRRRVPTLVWASCTLAAVVVGVLGVAVARHLAGPSAHHEHALFRAGAGPDGPLLGGKLLTSWQLDAVAVAVVVLLAGFYLTAVALRAADPDLPRWPVVRTLSFLAGLAVILFATNGSIAVYDQVLFTAHMLGHLSLVMIAPALLMAGNPLKLAVEASGHPERLRRVLRSRAVSLLTAPPVALALYTVVIVSSHLTGLMDTIMRVEWAGQVEHLAYLLSGCLFFSLIVGEQPLRWALAVPVRWVLLGVAMAVDTFTGVILLMSSAPIGMVPTPGVAVNPLSDTRTGGAIMWVGGDGIMVVIMIALVIGWLREPAGQRAGSGWLEQARQAEFRERVGGDGTADLDESEDSLAAYNEWLAAMDRRR